MLDSVLAGALEQINQQFQVTRAQVAEHTLARLDDRAIERGKEFQPGGGDSGGNHPAVLRVTGTLGEAAPFEPVKETGDIGVSSDHAAGDLAAGEPVRTGAAKDAQHIVLGVGELLRIENGGMGALQSVSGAEEVEESLFLEEREGFGLFDVGGEFPGHGP